MALVMTGAVGVSVKVRVAVPVPPAFVALRLMFEFPVAVGVPEMTPVTVLMLRPAGNPMALKVVGLFVAVMV